MSWTACVVNDDGDCKFLALMMTTAAMAMEVTQLRALCSCTYNDNKGHCSPEHHAPSMTAIVMIIEGTGPRRVLYIALKTIQ
jgi:hypothetical protein